MKVLIVGGVTGGATAAGRLRRLNEHAEIIMFERGPYISFANCGLPYYIGGEVEEKVSLLLRTPEDFDEQYSIDVRVNNEVTSIDREKKEVTVKNHVTATEYTESYDTLLLAPGASPLGDFIPGHTLPQVFTLRDVPDAAAIRSYVEEHSPKHAVVVGGGYIGLEMVENLAFHDIEISLVHRGSHLLNSLDDDMAGHLHEYIETKGIDLQLGREVSHIEAGDAGQVMVHCTGEKTPLTTDLVILALGVTPDSQLAQEAGLTLSVKNTILVDKYMQTSDPSIYAVGDVVAVPHFVSGALTHVPLAGPANKQARIVADNISGLSSVYRGAQSSSILKIFDFLVATTGVGEQEAKKAGLDADSVVIYEIDHAGYYPGAEEFALKVIYEKHTGTILGGQVVGSGGADKRADVIATAVRGRMTAQDLTDLDLCYSPPFGIPRDAVNLAGYVIENRRAGLAPTYRWEDVDRLPKDDSAVLLDVRTAFEVERDGLEPGFLNIPINQLRSKIDEVPKGKPIYLSCNSGTRSYIAARILAGYGHQVYSLCGGWIMYQSAHHEDKKE